MAHDHHHDHGQSSSTKLRWALAITAGFMLVEVFAGVWTGSLALIADAGHMLTDTAALALAVWAISISLRPPDQHRSYGYHRMQVLAAFVNALSLIAIALWILIEAARRLYEPAPVLAGPMLAVAVTGFFVNLLAYAILRGGHDDDLNRRGAMLHVLSDLLGSAAAIVAAGVMLATDWWPIDPLLSALTAALIGRTGWKLSRQTGHVLLEGADESIAPARVTDRLRSEVPAIVDVHHIHSWLLKPGMPLMTLHVSLRVGADADQALHRVHAVLQNEFGCAHATVQIEAGSCPDHGATHQNSDDAANLLQ